ncbi:MAG: DNA polymerase, partial [Rhodospirillaceae bacterium]|nr:DNA polymerase [Rhodospirillaceae bacterium]
MNAPAPPPPAADKPLVLVDGSSYLFRAYHALPAFTSSRGEPTGAVFGVLNMLYKLLEEFEPERIAVVFDAPGRTFRDDLYAEYKAHRPPMPEDLRPQVEPLLEAVEAIGMPVLRVQGVEADDVIGTLATRAGEAGIPTLISTSDKDMAQLVNAHVTLVNTMSGTTLDADGVRGKFGVSPEQIVDYLALVGDASDNIPGVPGVGPKTAAKWLAEHGDLDALTAQAGTVRGKVGERLRESLDRLPLYQALVTIDCDVALPVTLESLPLRAPASARLRALYERLELRALLRRVAEDAPAEPSAAPEHLDYDTLFTEDALREWLARIEAAELVAVDTETTSLDYRRAEIVGISLATEPGKAAYLPLAHRYPGAPEQLDRARALALLTPWLEGPAPKVGHHLKYDAHVLLNHGIRLNGIAFDSMLESFVLNSTATRHDMDSVASKYLQVETTKYEDVAGKGARQIGFDQVDIETAARYAAEDADIALRIHRTLWPKLQAIPELEQLYRELEQPLVGVLQKMEYTGVRVDAAMLRRQSHELAQAMAETEAQAHAAAGGPFNLDSPKQLQEILYERLELTVRGRTPKGQPSTAENVLQELTAEHALPGHILRYRALAK